MIHSYKVFGPGAVKTGSEPNRTGTTGPYKVLLLHPLLKFWLACKLKALKRLFDSSYELLLF